MSETPVTILYIEDREESRYLISRRLRQEGFTVIEAKTGQEALQKLDSHVDCVLLDVKLPDINGFELCQEIKSQTFNKFLPVVMISAAFVEDHHQVHGLEGGADAYLIQPVNSDVLVATLKALLRISSAEKEILSAARVWQTTFDAISDGICVLDLSGKVRLNNQAMLPLIEMLNLGSVEQGIPKLLALLPPEAQPLVQVQRTHQRFATMLHVQNCWLEITADPVMDESQQLSHLILTIADVTAQKQSEEALRINEERFRTSLKNSPVIVFNQDRELRYTWIYNPTTQFDSQYILGQRDSDLIDDEESVALLTRLKQEVLLHGGGTRHEVSLTNRGETRHYNLTIEPLRNAVGEITGITCASADVTSLKEAQNAERDQRVLTEAMHDVLIALSSTLKLPEVLDRLLANISKVVSHDAADIMLIEDSMVYVARSSGYSQHNSGEYHADYHFRLEEHPALKTMLKTRMPLVMPDVRHNPNWVQLTSDPRLLSYVGVPIIFQGQVLGFLNVSSSEPDAFPPEIVERLQYFASQAAIAIQNARLYEQAQQVAILEERQRLSRELHDAVSQTLFASSITAESLVRAARTNPDLVEKQLGNIHLLNRSALAEMRNLLFELRLTEDSEVHLTVLLQQLADAARGKGNFEVEVQLQDNVPLPREMRLTFYRIAQEAFSNIYKHASPKRVWLTFRSSSRGAYLSIRDNGRGFDMDREAWGSMGLKIMRERSEAIHAQLEITSAIGKGTEVTLTWQSPAAED